MSMRVVIVGGRSRAARILRARLAQQAGYAVTILTRATESPCGDETVVVVNDYFSPPAEVLSGADVVVNFAGLVSASEDMLRAVNVEGLERLARSAKRAGVKHMVHISSLSVYGRAGTIDRQTPEAPVSAYGRSKLAGDRAIIPLANDGFLVTQLRVPILYGKQTGGKLHKLARIMARLAWFPVPRQREPRSVLHLENLAGAIEAVICQRLDGIRFAADPEPFYIDRISEAWADRGHAIRLVPFPSLFFLMVRVLSPDIYTSLYGKSLIARADCISIPGAQSLRQGMLDVFAKTEE